MTEDKRTPPSPIEQEFWGKTENGLWQKAMEETASLQRAYNELLGSIDRFRHVPSLESQAPDLQRLLHELNRLHDVPMTPDDNAARRYSFRWWLRRISPSWWARHLTQTASRPLLDRQGAFQSVLVHFLNDLVHYLSSCLQWQQQFFEIQMMFFLKITPAMDVKIRELKAEENHNIAFHVGTMVHEHIPRAFQEYNRQLQNQIRDLLKYIEPYQIRMKKLLEPLERQAIPETIRIQEQQILDLQRTTEELWHGVQKQHHEMSHGFAAVKEHFEHLVQEQERLRQESAKQSPEMRPENYNQERILIELEELKRQTGMAPGVTAESNAAASPPQAGAADFRYFVFEEIFRGSSELIRERMKRYLPFFQDAPEPILDIGCGRGEFLTLMREAGKRAVGAEINAYEASRLREKAIHIVQEDAIRYLESLEKESIGGVFCAQVVEHLRPEDAFSMIRRLSVVMKPGAPLVIETLNPLSVASYHSYYILDPTHVFPVHAQTLNFWFRYAGFCEVQTQYITPFPQEALLPEPDLLPENDPVRSHLSRLTKQLNELLYGYAEYYVVGYRP